MNHDGPQMKRIPIALIAIVLLLSAACHKTPPIPPAPKESFQSMATHPHNNDFTLSGRWHVMASTFPMWLDPHVHCPTLNYTPDGNTILDQVSYTKDGKHKNIWGHDTQAPSNPLHFTWRGHGWMFFLTSDWYIRASGPGWMVIYFSPTLFTPDGFDVLVQEKLPSKTQWDKIIHHIHKDPLLSPLANQLTHLDTQSCGIKAPAP
jgi:hypothetical protein